MRRTLAITGLTLAVALGAGLPARAQSVTWTHQFGSQGGFAEANRDGAVDPPVPPEGYDQALGVAADGSANVLLSVQAPW